VDIETCVKVLSIATQAMTTPCTLDEALGRITGITGSLMETEQTGIFMRDEAREVFVVRSCTGVSGPNVRVGHPLVVPERVQRILWRLRYIRQIGGIDTGIEGLGFPMLVIPLRIKGERIGLLITSKPVHDAVQFGETKRQLFKLVSCLSSLVIENAKVYDYLNQQFAQRSHELLDANRADAGQNDETHQLMVSSLRNPDKVVRLLASSFYKELVRAGFSPGHITTAAAEILGCITRQEKV